MRLRLRRSRRSGYLRLAVRVCLLVTMLSVLSVTTVFADSATATATLTGGSLTESTGSAPAINATLNGTDQLLTYTMAISVDDATGTGNGWNLTITSTQFSTGGTTPSTLSTTASTITGVTSVCVANTTCTDPTNTVTYPLALPAGATAPTAVKLFNAAANTGMGSFTVTPTVSVSVPANAYAGKYSSTVTLAIVSGP